MSLYSGVYEYLTSVAGIQTAFGTDPRIYQGKLPDSAALPYATVQIISAAHEHYQRAAAGICNKLVQFDVWASTSESLDTCGEALRSALQGMTLDTWDDVSVKRVFLQNQRDTYEIPEDGSEVGLFRRSMDFEIWHAESIPTFS
jgi:hypothetical protein